MNQSLTTPSFIKCLSAMLYESLLLLGVLVFGLILPYILLGALLGIAAPAWVHRTHLVALLGLYFIWFWLNGGQTLAMRTWKIRIVDKSGRPLRPIQALFRYLAAWLSFVFFIGFFWRFIDPDKQFLHDRLAGSRLILTHTA